jgi:methanogenic corrinoid protein MtbC1
MDLGANVPTESLVEVAAAATDLVAIGISLSSDVFSRNVAGATAAAHETRPGVAVLVGGPAVRSEEAARDLGGDGWAPDSAGAAELVGQLAPRS